MGVGRAIKNLATIKGMTLKELSEKSGISYRAITSIVARDSDKINEDTYKVLSKALGFEGISVEDFIYCGEAGQGREDQVETRYPIVSNALRINGYSIFMNDEGQCFIRVPWKNDLITISEDDMYKLENKVSKSVFKEVVVTLDLHKEEPK